MTQVTVVGLGYVGLVSAAGLASRGHRVRGIDADAERVRALALGHVPFFEPELDDLVRDGTACGALSFEAGPAATTAAVGAAEVVLVAVGTHDPSGAWQTRTIEACLTEVVPAMRDGASLVIRSTTPPDALDSIAALVRGLRDEAGLGRVSVLLNPEFTREGSAVHDFLHPDRIVIGALDDPDATGSARVQTLYEAFDAPVLTMSASDAALGKLGSNLFLATKISFANELARLCDRFGGEVDRVVEVLALDARIGGSFLRPGVGFGGSCLPHQVATTVRSFEAEGEPLPLLSAVEAVNVGQRERCVALLARLAGGLAGRRIAVLGLTFKPNTDDLRDSPAIAICHRLQEMGAEVVAYDPMDRARDRAAATISGLRIATSALDALAGADAAAIVTDWPEFADIDWPEAARTMHRAALVDGRNLLDPVVLHDAGLAYAGFGRGSRDPLAETAAADGHAVRPAADPVPRTGATAGPSRLDALGAVMAFAPDGDGRADGNGRDRSNGGRAQRDGRTQHGR